MSKRITKRYLEEIGLLVDYPYVYKTKGHKNPKRLKKQVTYAGANEIKYIFYSIWHDGRIESMTEARLVYAWYKGEVPENCDVGHFDGNVLNNSPSNLMILPRKGRKMQL